MNDFNTMDDIKMVSILKLVKNNLINLFGNRLQNIMLYGSYTRNDYTNESDIVLSIYTQTVKEYNEKLDILPFLQNIKKEVVKIYG
jgi:predicted nucleotidyltransferase